MYFYATSSLSATSADLRPRDGVSLCVRSWSTGQYFKLLNPPFSQKQKISWLIFQSSESQIDFSCQNLSNVVVTFSVYFSETMSSFGRFVHLTEFYEESVLVTYKTHFFVRTTLDFTIRKMQALRQGGKIVGWYPLTSVSEVKLTSLTDLIS